MENKLLRQKVAYAIDKDAEKTAAVAGNAIAGGNYDLKAVAESINAQSGAQVTFASQGWVPKTNQDGGLAAAASKLSKDGVSSVVRSTTGDGYYFVETSRQ